MPHSGELNQLIATYIAKPKTTIFAPGESIRNRLIELINLERSSIHIAKFSFTDDDILGALSQPKKKSCCTFPVYDTSPKYN